jgi:glycosyltransferase involved in cell wall biosynthesis
MADVLCLMSQLLGNSMVSRRICDSLDRLHITHRVITFGSEDYRRYPASRLARLSAVTEVTNSFRKKWDVSKVGTPDFILVNGWELASVAVQLLHGVPIAVALDSTPALMAEQSRSMRRSLPRRAASRIVGGLSGRMMQRTAQGVSAWMPMSSWCANSLVKDFGVDASSCFVTLSPQPYLARVPTIAAGRPLRALFVGNDFKRKGGDLLFDMFRALKPTWMTLTIVTNDPILSSYDIPSGVTLVQGMHTPEDIRSIYLDSDVLLFPSLRDQFGNVVAEAMMAGVAPIVSNVGGVLDIVHDQVTGLVLERDQPWQAWARALVTLSENPDVLLRLATAAKQFADTHLSLDKFDQLLGAVVKRLAMGSHAEPEDR